MLLTNPNKVTRSGLKYWLSPQGELYQTEEHSVGAKRWGMENLDNPSPTFGVSNLMSMGWLRLVTEKTTIWVTGGKNARAPQPTSQQRDTLEALSDQFIALNRTKPDIKIGDGITSLGDLPTTTPDIVRKADVANIPSFYKQKGRLFGDSVRRFLNNFLHS